MTQTYDINKTEAEPEPGDPARPLTVYQAIAEIRRRLKAIPKSDKAPTEMGGYSYRGIETIMAELSPLLAEFGVFAVPSVTILSREASPAMPNGWLDTTIEVDWTVMGPDGSGIAAKTCGTGRDKSDKGVTKAQTQAYKYLMLPLFSIADASTDADALAYEPHVEAPPPVKVIEGPVQDGLLARVAALNDENKEHLVKWFRENEVPPIRKLPVDRFDEVEAIIDHFENLEDAQAQEQRET